MWLLVLRIWACDVAAGKSSRMVAMVVVVRESHRHGPVVMSELWRRVVLHWRESIAIQYWNERRNQKEKCFCEIYSLAQLKYWLCFQSSVFLSLVFWTLEELWFDVWREGENNAVVLRFVLCFSFHFLGRFNSWDYIFIYLS